MNIDNGILFSSKGPTKKKQKYCFVVLCISLVAIIYDTARCHDGYLQLISKV